MKRTLILSLILTGLLAGGRVATAQNTNAAAPTNALDLKSFMVIYQHNIFNPNRTSGRTRPAPIRHKVDSFTLVGTMSSEKGPLAFFDGSSFEYRKTLKPSEKIAGYKIAQISSDYIKLAAAANRTIKLSIGSQMRRTDGGPWSVAGTPEPEANSPASASTPSSPGDSPAAAPTGGESDAMKRLMLKRLSEK